MIEVTCNDRLGKKIRVKCKCVREPPRRAAGRRQSAAVVQLRALMGALLCGAAGAAGDWRRW